MKSLMIASFVVCLLMVSPAEAGRRNRRCVTYAPAPAYLTTVRQEYRYRSRGQVRYSVDRGEREFQPFRRPIRTILNIHPLGRIIQGKHPLFFVR